MIPEAALEQTEHGLAATGSGWFVVNAREAAWRERPGRGFYCELEGKQDFSQLGINVQVLGPGQPMSMYHYENDQEDFLVVAGEALLIVEGEERPLRAWDFVHTPAGAKHTIVGAGSGCVVIAVGARDRSVGPDWGATPWTRRRCATAPGSSRRRRSRPRPTHTSARVCGRATARACCRISPDSSAPLPRARSRV